MENMFLHLFNLLSKWYTQYNTMEMVHVRSYIAKYNKNEFNPKTLF